MATFLRDSYPEPLRTDMQCTFSLVSSNEFDDDNPFPDTTLSLFLYRVTINEHLRNNPRMNAHSNVQIPLAVDLHYLLTVWADNVRAEHTILAWTMRQLYLYANLDTGSLGDEAEWSPDDYIRVSPTELTTEDMMRIWDSLKPSYRLSVTYRANVVRIDSDTQEDARPVLATRFSFTDEPDASRAESGS